MTPVTTTIPKEKVEFKTFMKIPRGSEKEKCYYPFKFDPYGCGCHNDCLYCYSKAIQDFRNMWSTTDLRVANFEKVKEIFDNFYLKGRSRFQKYLQARIPLRIGGFTDAFAHTEKEEKVTLKLLELLKHYEYPYLILTKNTLPSTPEYLDALDPDLAYIQYSITTPYDDISNIYEPGAELTSERLESALILHDEGFYTANRINPLFPIYRDGHYSGTPRLIEDEPFKYFDWSLIPLLKDAGFQTVIAGFLRLSSWNVGWIKEATGLDIKELLFDPDMKYYNYALHFSTEEKRYYYERIKEMCDHLKMDFSVCYDGDEDYKTFQYLWSNPDDCCNGIGNIPGFTFNMDMFRGEG